MAGRRATSGCREDKEIMRASLHQTRRDSYSGHWLRFFAPNNEVDSQSIVPNEPRTERLIHKPGAFLVRGRMTPDTAGNHLIHFVSRLRASGCFTSARTMSGMPIAAGNSQNAIWGSSLQSGKFLPLST